MTLQNLNHLVGLGTLLLQIATLSLLIIFLFRKNLSGLSPFISLIARLALPVSFVFSLLALFMSLYYSEVLGLAPCGLCWAQRVFMYPQVILFGIALWKKDRGVVKYSIALSLIGALIALYQHYLQVGGEGILPCPAVSTGADCAQRILFEFGYITFPLVSFSLFAFLIVLMLYFKYSSHQEK